MSDPDSEATPALKELTVDNAAAGARLDQWLAASLGPDLSRSRVQALIKQGAVTLDGKPVTETKRKVSAGDAYSIEIPEAEPAEQEIEDGAALDALLRHSVGIDRRRRHGDRQASHKQQQAAKSSHMRSGPVWSASCSDAVVA